MFSSTLREKVALAGSFGGRYDSAGGTHRNIFERNGFAIRFWRIRSELCSERFGSLSVRYKSVGGRVRCYIGYVIIFPKINRHSEVSLSHRLSRFVN